MDSLHTSNCTTTPYRLCSLSLLWPHLPVVLVGLGGTTLAVTLSILTTAWHLSALQRVEVLMVDAYITKDLRKPCSDDNMVSANWVSISSKNPKSKTFQNRTSWLWRIHFKFNRVLVWPLELKKLWKLWPCLHKRETAGLQNDNPKIHWEIPNMTTQGLKLPHLSTRWQTGLDQQFKPLPRWSCCSRNSSWGNENTVYHVRIL